MQIGAEHHGSVSECPACSRLMPVPPKPADHPDEWPTLYPPNVIAVEIIFRCPACEARLSIDVSNAGTQVQCPPCKQTITVPQVTRPPTSRRTETARVNLPLVARLSPQEIEFLSAITGPAVESGR